MILHLMFIIILSIIIIMITKVQDGNVFVEQSGHSKSHRSFTTLAQ